MPSEQKPQSLLFVIGFNCPFPGAGWNRISYLARHFKANGIDCSILSTFSPLAIKQMKVTEAKNIRIYDIVPQFPLDNPFFLILNNIIALIFSFPFFLFKKPDVVILSIAPANQLMSVYWLSKLFRTRLIIDYRDEVEDNWLLYGKKWKHFYGLMKKVFSRLYQQSWFMTPTTSAVARNLMQRGVSNIYVVADGVDTTLFKPLNKKEMKNRLNITSGTFVMIFLGYVYSAYRVDIIIKALKVLKDKNPENKNNYLLLLAGDGFGKLLKFAESLGVNDMVRYVGLIKDTEEVVKVINAADIGIIPYDDNPLWKRMYPTKLFEYTACGLPIVGTVYEDSILAEYLQKYSIGVTAPPLDCESLANAIEDVRAILRVKTEMNFNSLSFASKHDKARIAAELLSRIEEAPFKKC